MRKHLTYANVMATLAVALVVAGGTAYAANTVFSTDIVNGEVKRPDIGNNAVDGPKVASNSLTGADIKESSINQVGASANGACNADNGLETSCASVEVTLGEPGKLAVTGTGAWVTVNFDDPGSGSDNTNWVIGACRLTVDGAGVGVPQTMGETRTIAGANAAHGNLPGTLALTGVSDQLAAGNHVVQVRCTETDGDIDWTTINLSAVGIGS
jgi:hypothetical protein